MENKLVELKHVKKYFSVSGSGFAGKKEIAKALDGVDFDIYEGETVGLVGESGCGKTTVGRTLLGLIPATEGEIWYDGANITNYTEKQRHGIRKEMQIIFQDPYSSLNPRQKVFDIIAAPLKIHTDMKKEEMTSYVKKLMEEVGLRSDYGDRYPHEFSGGQRQRIGIARAIGIHPKLIICDEPVSALDVSVQAQVVNLLKKLQKEYGLTYLFISHDLRVVKHLCDRVVVMYLGKVVESGNKEDIYAHPAHPYTKALLSSIPDAKGEKKKRVLLKGDIPSPINVPRGCRFHTRCPMATDQCRQVEPEGKNMGNGHISHCHYS